MDFLLLGPFQAVHDGAPVALGGRRQERCVLAMLLLAPGRRLSVARIEDLLWDGKPPASGRGAIHTYVGRLRRTLAPYGMRISTRGDGYQLEPGTYTVDLDEFTALVRNAATVTVPIDQVLLYTTALNMWRGPLLSDVVDDALRARLDPALDEQRLTAIELRAQAQLSMGQHDQVVADLTPEVDATPTRERMVDCLMTALYRSGRQSEALVLYRHTRSVLRKEVGVEPSRELQTLHSRILRTDPALDRPVRPTFAVQVGDQWLPWQTSGDPALEFCNTYAGWAAPPHPRSEWLRSYATLAAWAGHHDLADARIVTRLRREAEREPSKAAAVLDRARELRAHLYACLTNSDYRESFRGVARFIDAAARHTEYRLGDDGLGRWSVALTAGLHLPVHAVALAAADLLADPRRMLVRACPAPACGWLFLDHTGQRRYCSIALCEGSTPSTHQLTQYRLDDPVPDQTRNGIRVAR